MIGPDRCPEVEIACPAVLSDSKAGKLHCSNPKGKVKFSDTNVSTYLTDGELKYTPPASTQKDAKSNKKFCIDDAHWKEKSSISHSSAIKRAKNWSIWLGTSLPHSKDDASDASTQDTGLPESGNESNESDSDASVAAENSRREWIADTGSGHDLIGENDLEGNFEYVEGKTVQLKTAGGKTST